MGAVLAFCQPAVYQPPRSYDASVVAEARAEISRAVALIHEHSQLADKVSDKAFCFFSLEEAAVTAIYARDQIAAIAETR